MVSEKKVFNLRLIWHITQMWLSQLSKSCFGRRWNSSWNVHRKSTRLLLYMFSENSNQEKLPECPEMGKNHAQQRCTHVVTADGNQTLANQSMREAQAKQTLKGAFGTNNRRDLNLLKYQGTASNSPGPGTYDPGKWHPEPVTGNTMTNRRRSCSLSHA